MKKLFLSLVIVLLWLPSFTYASISACQSGYTLFNTGDMIKLKGATCGYFTVTNGPKCYIPTNLSSCPNSYNSTNTWPSCTANSTRNGSSCTCNSGFNEVSGSCLPTGNECTAPKIYNASTLACDDPPPCPVGQVKNLTNVTALSSAQGTSNLIRVLVCSNGCQFSITSGKTADCYTSFAGGTTSNIYCPATYEGNGNTCSGSDAGTTSNPPASPPPAKCPPNNVMNENGICMLVRLCPADSTRNSSGSCVAQPCKKGYERVAGVDFCVPIQPDTPQACPTGTYRDLTTKDCLPDTRPVCTGSNCFTDENAKKNSDGSIDYDNNPSTSGAGEQGSPRNNDATRDDDNNPETTGTGEVGDTDTPPDDPNNPNDGWGKGSTNGGSFDTDGQGVTDAQNALTALYNQIKGEIGQKFTLNLSSTSALPCDSVSLGAFGTFRLCVSDYADELNLVGQMIMLVGSILSLFIILA